MKKQFTLTIAIISALLSCKNDKTASVTNVKHNTLLVATEGKIINFNLEEKKIAWQYESKFDTAGNRNYFVLDGQNIFIPFESGKFINFDVNTGKIIWNQEVFGSEDGPIEMSNDEQQQAEMLEKLKPLFMTTPLIDGENVLITSTGQSTQSKGYLYCYNRTNGKKKWSSSLPTTFNFYAPVKYRNNYFVNSAVFLQKHNIQDGTATSYGMFDGDIEIAGQPTASNPPNQFEKPIYNQMQSGNKNIFIGDESGKFYCFELDKTGNLPDGDISDPNNTFIKNPKIFKWTFSDKQFNFQKSNITFLENNTLFVEMKTGLADQSCLFALDADQGKVKWRKIIKGDVIVWNLKDDKIMGNTENTIFWLDTNGENYTEVKTENKVLSNIDLLDKTHLIYITQKGIESLDVETKKTTLLFSKTFNSNEFNNVQVKYIGK